MTIKRDDIHRPSVIKPEDYEFVAIIYAGKEADSLAGAVMNAGERDQLRRHMKATGGKFSDHAHGGSCHICGAWAATLAYFHHYPSNQYIVTGEICCNKLDGGHAGTFKAIRDEATALLEAKAGKMKAKGILGEAGLGACYDIYECAYEDLPKERDGYAKYEERTIRDIVEKLVKYGSISDKQESFLRSLLGKIEKRDELAKQREEEAANAAPVPVTEDRIKVEGKIISTRWDSGFGYYDPDVLKILVKHESGYKLWGSCPRAVADDAEKGDSIEFMAKVEPSKDDEKFGFFKRPTKVKLIKAEEDAA